MKQKVLSFILLIALLGTFTTPVSAATTDLTYKYTNINDLTKVEKAKIVSGNPKISATHDSESYQLIYQKNGSSLLTSGSHYLPATGDKGLAIVLVASGILLILAALAIKSRNRKWTHFLLIAVVLASLFTAYKPVQAKDVADLKAPVMEVATQGHAFTHTPEKIKGYTYKGYIPSFNNAEELRLVSVKYVAEETGKEIHPEKLVNGNLGDNYDVSSKTYQPQINGYELDESKLPENAKGTFTTKAQTVTYVYKENKADTKAGDITVNYVDENGNEIYASKTISGKVNEAYDATTETYQPQIDGYELDESKLPENAKGTFTTKAQTVTYVYKESKTGAGDITVNYVDENGNEIYASKTISGKVNEAYDATTETYQPQIDGYELDESKLPENAKGTFTTKAQTVTYVYKESKAGDITVNYVDENGNEIYASKTISGKVNEAYDATTETYQPQIDGYELDESKLPENAKGTFTTKAQTVTYVYKESKAGDITVNYVDGNGNEIYASKTISGKVNEAYDATTETYQPQIDGYELDESKLPENAKGTFTTEAQTVTYVYKETAATITIRFVDKNGNPYRTTNLATYGAGKLAEKYPLADQYSYQSSLDSAIYPQNSLISDITIPTEIGASYEFSEKLTFSILDENKNTIDSLSYKGEDNYFYVFRGLNAVTSSEASGTVEQKNTVIEYVVTDSVGAYPPDDDE